MSASGLGYSFCECNNSMFMLLRTATLHYIQLHNVGAVSKLPDCQQSFPAQAPIKVHYRWTVLEGCIQTELNAATFLGLHQQHFLAAVAAPALTTSTIREVICFRHAQSSRNPPCPCTGCIMVWHEEFKCLIVAHTRALGTKSSAAASTRSVCSGISSIQRHSLCHSCKDPEEALVRREMAWTATIDMVRSPFAAF